MCYVLSLSRDVSWHFLFLSVALRTKFLPFFFGSCFFDSFGGRLDETHVIKSHAPLRMARIERQRLYTPNFMLLPIASLTVLDKIARRRRAAVIERSEVRVHGAPVASSLLLVTVQGVTERT